MVWSILRGGPRRAAAIGLALAGVWLLAPPAFAQTPTAAQIEAFKALSPEQQQELMRQFGIDPSTLGIPTATAPTTSPTTTTLPTDGSLPMTLPLPVEEEIDEEPRLEAGSTLLLDVTESIGLTFQQLDPAAAESATAPLPQQTTGNRSFIEFQRGVRRGNPYQLDRMGRLVLPNQVVVPLAGLTIGHQAV